MAERYDQRFRRNQPVRGFDEREGGWGDSRAHARGEWEQEDWQPESGAGNSGYGGYGGYGGSRDWDDERRAERLGPGQLSEGGPPREYPGYGSDYGQRRFPDYPSSGESGGRGGNYWAERRRAEGYAGRYADRNEAERRWERGASGDAGGGTYGGTYGSTYGGYGSSAGARADRDFERDSARRDERGCAGQRSVWSESGSGSTLRYGLNGGDDEERRGGHGFGGGRLAPRPGGAAGADSGGYDAHQDPAWSRGAGRHRWNEPAGQRQGDFNETRGGRSGTGSPYRTTGSGHAGSRPWGDDAAWRGGRGSSWEDEWSARRDPWESRDTRNMRDTRGDLRGHGDEFEEQGALYRIGRRIGEVVGDWFGDDDDTDRDARRRTGPKGYQRSDERIREIVCERLAYANGVDVDEVSVDVKDGVVTLTGSVRRRSEKYDVEDIADGVYGVRDVENNIRVRRPGEPYGAGDRDTDTARGYAASLGAELGMSRDSARDSRDLTRATSAAVQAGSTETTGKLGASGAAGASVAAAGGTVSTGSTSGAGTTGTPSAAKPAGKL